VTSLIVRTRRTLVPALAVAVCVAGAARSAQSPPGDPPIAGSRQVALHIHVVGSGGYDPYNPSLQTDYMALEIPSDGGHYLAKEGAGQWFTWSVLLPQDFPTQRGWGVITEWKGVGVGFNNLANIRLDVTDDILRLYTSGGNPGEVRTANGIEDRMDPRYGPRYERTFALGAVPKGVWQTFYLHVLWSPTMSGSVELWRAIDGGKPVRLLAPHPAATLYADWPAVRYPMQDLYHKGGQPNLGTISDLYQTPIQWGTTVASALTTPSLQVTQGEWFGDDKSSGSLVPVSALPVPLPSRILAPGAAGAAAAAKPATKPKPVTKPKPATQKPATPKPAHSSARSARVVTEPGCSSCRVRISSAGIRASIDGGEDENDTAVWTRTVTPGRPLTVSDAIRVGSAHPLDDNLAILQLRQSSGVVVWEIYVAPDGSLRLWSPPGALKTVAVNRQLGVLAPALDSAPARLAVQLTPRRSLVVRVGGRAVLSLSKLTAASGRGSTLRVGVDHYDGSAGNAIVVLHSGVRVAD
jgi:Polysaccharide lyase